jgi:tRNA threonylcarbamoyl adenosine modification protein (Sua5/YciO/YrdC/YwlC family)
MRFIRQVDAHHYFTLVCRDLSEIATYAKVDNRQFRLLKAVTPGSYTFILQATREVPKRLQHPSRRTVGLRVPDHRVVHALLDELGEPLLSSTLLLPGDALPLNEPYEIRERLGNLVDLILDGGPCGIEPTTVVNLCGETPVIMRAGRGSTAPFSS